MTRLHWLTAAILLAACAGLTFWVQSDTPVGDSAPPVPATPPETGLAENRTAASDASSAPFRFTNVIENSGIAFEYYGGPGPNAHMIEQNGGGVALFDFDHDGHLDIFLSNGSRLDQPAQGDSQASQLYRSVAELSYQEVSRESGVNVTGFGQGCAAGDFDNDGFMDLFLACFGPNRFWRNNGDGTFSELPADTLPDGDAWSTSAAFADLDSDANADLCVTNYVDWSPEREPVRENKNNLDLKLSASPVDFSGQRDLLYHSNGDGTFTESGHLAGAGVTETAKGLALSVADFNGDRKPDIYIANDTTNNSLFINQGNLQFAESAVPLGTAVSNDGVIGASMGIAVSDFDRNGFPDLCVTNFQNQVHDLYFNLGPSGFVAANTRTGLDLYSRPRLSFGIVAGDFDLNGWDDLFVANGHIWNLEEAGTNNEYRMLPSLFLNEQGRRFRDVTQTAGDYFQNRWLGRAVAAGDLDNDGDTDLVVLHLLDQPAVLRNDSPRTLSSVTIELIGTRATRCPQSIAVTFHQPDLTLTGHVPAGESFQACHDSRVIFAARPDTATQITVLWPESPSESWTLSKATDGVRRLIQGTGNPAQ